LTMYYERIHNRATMQKMRIKATKTFDMAKLVPRQYHLQPR